MIPTMKATCIFMVFLLVIGCGKSDGNDPSNKQIDKEEFYLNTPDSVALFTTFWRSSEKSPQPAVILIHQAGSNHSEWDNFANKLVKYYYNVISYDIRGHGKSTPVKDIYALFDDPHLAPVDLRTVIHYLKQQSSVDSTRIAIVGASIGGNLACVGVAHMGIKTAVAISAKTSAVYHLANADRLNLNSIFYIASLNDQGGKRAARARELFQLTVEPRKLNIVGNSDAHGVGVFSDAPDELGEILNWLRKQL